MKLPSFNILQKKQFLLLWGCVSVLLTIVFILLRIVMDPGILERTSASYKAPITTGSRRTDPKEVWMEKITSDLDLSNKRLDSMEKMLSGLFKLNTPAAAPSINQEQRPSTAGGFEADKTLAFTTRIKGNCSGGTKNAPE